MAAAEAVACDTVMIAAWRRTFYAPYAVNTPVRGYFIPRRPNCDCWGGAPLGWAATPVCAAEIEATGIERLGRIPNELDLSGPGLPPGSSR
jgi:hypothetical protein